MRLFKLPTKRKRRSVYDKKRYHIEKSSEGSRYFSYRLLLNNHGAANHVYVAVDILGLFWIQMAIQWTVCEECYPYPPYIFTDKTRMDWDFSIKLRVKRSGGVLAYFKPLMGRCKKICQHVICWAEAHKDRTTTAKPQ